MDSIVKAVLENSELYPEKIAVATAQKKITYNELRKKILSFAASLKMREIKKGSRIAVEAVDLPSFFAACLGCHLAGMISVPIERNISIYKVISKKGYRVPEDIQIIGFDNISFSWLSTPEITTIAQPIKKMGKKAAQIIIQHKKGEEIEKENVFDVKLIQRQTTKIKG